eukprot:scaffold95158_cov19-Prasinocladus_malaysianus.AAC.1
MHLWQQNLLYTDRSRQTVSVGEECSVPDFLHDPAAGVIACRPVTDYLSHPLTNVRPTIRPIDRSHK